MSRRATIALTAADAPKSDAARHCCTRLSVPSLRARNSASPRNSAANGSPGSSRTASLQQLRRVGVVILGEQDAAEDELRAAGRGVRREQRRPAYAPSASRSAVSGERSE